MDAFNALCKKLQRQGSVGHISDGLEFGLSTCSVRNYWRRHGWPMPHRGVIVLPGAEVTFRLRALAAATWIGPPVALTACAALHLHGVLDRTPRELQFVVPHSRRNRQWDGGSVHRSGVGEQREIRRIGHVPCMTPAWAIRDLAVYGGRASLRGSTIAAIQRRRTTIEELAGVVEANPTAARVPELAAILARLQRDRVDSGLELDTRDLVRTGGFEPWPQPFPFRCPDGKVIHLDVAFPEIWFAIECDDEATHGDSRSFYVDRTRWNQAMLGGWRLAFAWRSKLRTDPQAVLGEIAKAHQEAPKDRGPARPAHDCTALGC